MTLDQFWDHIQKSKRKDPDEHAERLAARLAKLPVEEILDFGHWWDLMLRESYTWNLWGAAYIINGGCSDDGFDYFRGWLILKGRDIFQAAVSKPDSLAKVVDPDEDFTEFEGQPAWDAWFAATGRKRTDKGYEALRAAEVARHGEPQPMPDLGDGWDFDDEDEMRKRYPKLSALYTADGGEDDDEDD
jgi:hypothetical protein